MYCVNGIDLSTREYELLEELVDAYDSGEKVAEKAKIHLAIKGVCQTYASLRNKGMVSGMVFGLRGLVTSFDFDRLNQTGIDFVHDYRIQQNQSEEEQRKQRRHDYKIAAFGVIGGLFSGALGSWLFSKLGELYAYLSSLNVQA